MSTAPLPTTPPCVLDPTGPQVVLGGADPFHPNIAPDRGSLFGPRSAFFDVLEGRLFIADTGHHRVVVHHRLPTRDRATADLVLGQPDDQTEARNAGRDEPTAQTMNVPTGLCRWGSGLAVADSWNNRVLVWRSMPASDGQPADLVLGQADFEHQRPNRDRAEPGPDTMHWPFQVLAHEGRLYVADAGNRRILVWRTLPEVSGQPADFVLGQADLTSRSDNGGSTADARSLRWPHDLTIIDGNLAVADAGNNRILIWEGLPDEANAPAARVLGQADFGGTDHNRATYWPTASALSMPYALASADGQLLVADTANSRIVAYSAPLVSGGPASRLTGQPHFETKGDNRNRLPVRDSLCWPYGLQVVDELAVVSDTGNHRVLLWRLAA